MALKHSLRALVALFTLALLALTPACQTPRTEVILVVDADATVRALIDNVYVETTSPGGEVRTAEATLGASDPELPRTLGLAWTGGALGPFSLRIVGRSATGTVVAREARFSFVREETRVLYVTLVGRCASTFCPSGQTCGEDGCRDIEIRASELGVWDGTVRPNDAGMRVVDGGVDGGRDAGRDAFVPPLDAFVGIDAASEPDAFVNPDAASEPDAFVDPDAAAESDAGVETDAAASTVDACPATTESCNGIDDDCNGTIDDGFDLMTDEANCGMCGRICMGGRTCCAGTCTRMGC